MFVKIPGLMTMISDISIRTGTRVPRKTGVPPRIHGFLSIKLSSKTYPPMVLVNPNCALVNRHDPLAPGPIQELAQVVGNPSHNGLSRSQLRRLASPKGAIPSAIRVRKPPEPRLRHPGNLSYTSGPCGGQCATAGCRMCP